MIDRQTALETMKLIITDMEISAEKTSPCPDIPERLWTREGYPRSAREAMALLVALPLVSPGTRDIDYYMDLVDHIRRMTEHHFTQGSWYIVEKLLNNYYNKSPAELLFEIISIIGQHDYYGNFIPEIRRALRSIKKQRLDYSVVTDTRPVQRIKRKRGYDDKGSYQRDPWPKISSSESKEKKEIFVKNPLPYRLWQRFKKGR